MTLLLKPAPLTSWAMAPSLQTQVTVAPAWTVEADQTDARLGGGVANAGDVNADGFEDVIVGAARWDDSSVVEFLEQ